MHGFVQVGQPLASALPRDSIRSAPVPHIGMVGLADAGAAKAPIGRSRWRLLEAPRNDGIDTSACVSRWLAGAGVGHGPERQPSRGRASRALPAAPGTMAVRAASGVHVGPPYRPDDIPQDPGRSVPLGVELGPGPARAGRRFRVSGRDGKRNRRARATRGRRHSRREGGGAREPRSVDEARSDRTSAQRSRGARAGERIDAPRPTLRRRGRDRAGRPVDRSGRCPACHGMLWRRTAQARRLPFTRGIRPHRRSGCGPLSLWAHPWWPDRAPWWPPHPIAAGAQLSDMAARPPPARPHLALRLARRWRHRAAGALAFTG